VNQPASVLSFRQREKAVPVTRGYFPSHDGTRIFYSSHGEGEPILFCYGLVGSSQHWSKQVDYFSKTHRTIWFDYRGHGNSDCPDDLSHLSFELITEDMKRLYEELGIKKATLAGHSMGTNVALAFTNRFPNKVDSLILANGTPSKPLDSLFWSQFFSKGLKFAKDAHGKVPKIVKTIWQLQKHNPLVKKIVRWKGFHPTIAEEKEIELFVKNATTVDIEVFLRFLEIYNEFDATSWLHEIKAPTLVISGTQDQVTPPDRQELMHQLIPNSKLISIAHGSHCPQIDLPDHVNLVIEQFLNESKKA